MTPSRPGSDGRSPRIRSGLAKSPLYAHSDDPLGPEYAASSNVDNAGRLKGRLLLIVGEMDTNVDPASTMQVANALITANKVFDLLVIPGSGHGMGGAYGERKMYDFFVRHLQGTNPPEWNRTKPA